MRFYMNKLLKKQKKKALVPAKFAFFRNHISGHEHRTLNTQPIQMKQEASDLPVVLTFIDWYLPGTNAGGPVRSLANLTHHLKDQLHFKIVTSNTDYLETVPYRDVPYNQWVEYSPGTEVYYLSPMQTKPSTFAKLIRNTPCDMIYVNGMYSLHFSILPVLYGRRYRLPLLIAPRGMVSEQAFSAKKLKKRIFLTLTRWLNLYKAVHFHATLNDEVPAIQQHTGTDAQRIYLAPNLFRRARHTSPPRRQKNPGELNMVSIARISPEKNTLYALQCLQSIGEGVTVRFDLYGGIYAPEYWKKCQAVIRKLPENIQVQYKGVASGADVPDLLQDYHLLFMPSTGENFGHSILESLMEGVPVLISDRTPWRALEQIQAGWALPLEQQEAFSEKIRQMALAEQSAYNQWIQGAYARAGEFINNQEHVQDSLSMFRAVINTAGNE